jgi:hypothetical protein
VDTDGRQTEEGGGEILAESNVVRLPRDWLGPREELIPFGPSADEPVAEVSEHIGLPPTADDFWGESSAAVQDALRAPPADRDGRMPLGPSGEVAGAAIPGSVPVAGAGSAPTRVARAGAREAIRRRARPISIIGVAAASALIVLALIGGGGQKSGVRGPLATGTPEASAGSNPATFQPAHGRSGRALAAALDLGAKSAATLRASRRSAARHARHRTARLAQAVHASTSAATVQPVHYTSSTPPYEGTASSTPASSAAPPTTTGSSGTSGQTPSSGSQPAFGPNGALGPGSSPDG